MTSRKYYHTHAQSYFEQTFGVDPSSFLLPLVKYLQPGAHVLDIGCGAGRDMLWLQSKGFSCTGLDSSPTLAELARQHTVLSVIEADFEVFEFQGMCMDALLLVGALVHVPHQDFKPIFHPMLNALKPLGHALVTMKQGRGTETRADERVFYLWQKEDLMRIFKNCGLKCLEYFAQQSKTRPTDTWMGFVLQRLPGPDL